MIFKDLREKKVEAVTNQELSSTYRIASTRGISENPVPKHETVLHETIELQNSIFTPMVPLARDLMGKILGYDWP
jgi:hypothetical protein